MNDTLQTYFDNAMQHLAGMPHRCTLQHSRTQRLPSYRGDTLGGADGYCDPLGVLIPDDVYHVDMEYTSINDLVELWPALKGVLYPDVEGGLAVAAAVNELHFDQRSWGPNGFTNWVGARRTAEELGLGTAVIDRIVR